MKSRMTTTDAYSLLHEGSLALSEVEATGFRIDVDYLDKTIEKVGRKVKQWENELREDDVFLMWRKKYGQKTNLGSREQLGDILFNEMGLPCDERTKKEGRPKMDESALERMDLPFVRKFVKVEKFKKVRSTFLMGIRKEVVDGLLRASYNLHIAKTFRSTSDSPNFQNLPIRDPVLTEIVRRCFIPRDGRVIIEIDYGGIEIHSAAWYHKDPRMMDYLNDKSKDMHRDMAALCFQLPKEEVSKITRYCGKNMFVFPQFYGDYYVNNAMHLWNAIERLKLKTELDGIPLKKHLETVGITERGLCDPDRDPQRGTFEAHIRKVQKRFWNKMFGVYGRWKDTWWKTYLQKGGFQTLTGFYIEGVMKRNEVINYPVQGVAFHCLLWALIRMLKKLRKRKMKTLIVGQIHDSIVADVPLNELEDFLALAMEVMVTELKKAWKFIITPIEIEAEACGVGETWHDKSEIEI